MRKDFAPALMLAVIALASSAVTRAAAQTFTVLYSFAYNSEPRSGVVFDAAGNLYGTTFEGGTYSHGTVYELSPQPDGSWTETILHSFNDDLVDGYEPFAGLALDSSGNLYGTTRAGGPQLGGVVFELTPAAS